MDLTMNDLDFRNVPVGYWKDIPIEAPLVIT